MFYFFPCGSRSKKTGIDINYATWACQMMDGVIIAVYARNCQQTNDIVYTLANYMTLMSRVWVAWNKTGIDVYPMLGLIKMDVAICCTSIYQSIISTTYKAQCIV